MLPGTTVSRKYRIYIIIHLVLQVVSLLSYSKYSLKFVFKAQLYISLTFTTLLRIVYQFLPRSQNSLTQ